MTLAGVALQSRLKMNEKGNLQESAVNHWWRTIIMRGVIPAASPAGIDRRNPPRNFQYTNALLHHRPLSNFSVRGCVLQEFVSTQPRTLKLESGIAVIHKTNEDKCLSQVSIKKE